MKIWPVEVEPALGSWDVPMSSPELAAPLPPPSSPLAPQNAADDSAELGDAGDRSWQLGLILPSSEARGRGGRITHKTPLRAATEAHQHIYNMFNH